MKKWIQKKMQSSTQDEQYQKRLTRRERYIKEFINSDKCIDFFNNQQSLIQDNNIKYPFNSLDEITNKALQQKYLQLLEKTTEKKLFAIFAVGFHHKRGSEIEFSYPDIKQQSADYEDIINKVTVYALPDAVHNADEDYLFFNFNCKINNNVQMLFGVTCFKQIKVTEEMRKHDPELTRSHLQKAICLLAYDPIFGELKNRLEPTIRAYFELQNFKDMSLIQFAYENLAQTLNKTDELHLMFSNSNPTAMFYIFKDKVMKILKALILELRIIVYSLSSSICSKFILTLLSFIPGLLNFRIKNKQINLQAGFLEQYGLPLKLFNSNYPLFMHFSVNDLPHLDDKNIKGYLIGTTNKFIKTMGKLDPDIIIDIDNEQLQIIKEPHKKLLNNKLGDKQLFNDINQAILKQIEHNQGVQLKKFNQFKGQDQCQYDEQINGIMNEYLLKILAETSYLKYNFTLFNQKITKLATVRTRKSIILKHHKELQQQNQQWSGSSGEEDNDEKVNDEEIHKHKEELIKELEIREIRNKIIILFKNICKYNRKFIQHWLSKTNNGLQWLQCHDICIHIGVDCYDENRDNIIKIFKNGNYYIGNQTYGALLEIDKHRIYLGQFKKFIKQGEGKYESIDDQQFQYKGQFVNNKMHGQGQLIIKDSYQYNGNFENDKFEGYGNLQYDDSVYEGWFKNCVYEGTGKLILPNKDCYVGNFHHGQFQGEGQYVWSSGNIYKGQFKNGKKCGIGLFQSTDSTYDGEWVEDKKEGFGELTLNECKIQAQFHDDQLIQDQQVIIKYEDKSIYQGQIVNYKPEGKGYLSLPDGTVKEGSFKNGQFIE